MNAFLFDLLRLGRTATLKILEPLDQARRMASGQDGLPPLWLRRHAGPLSEYERSVRYMDDWIGKLGLVQAGDLVLDVGCGAGAMAAQLGRRIGPEGHYIGVDVHRPSLAWAEHHFAADRRFRFVRAAVASRYGSGRKMPREPYRLPVDDGAAQFVLAKSLFTHLLEAETAAYLAQIRRVLEPRRAAVVTMFLFEEGGSADRGLLRSFRHPEPGASLRFRFRHRPEAAVAYRRSRFAALVEQAGLHIYQIHQGFLPGEDDPPRGQDVVLLGH